MAGHNKWSQIKRAKGVTDARRGKIFSKLAREITMLARLHGPDPDTNARLRMVLLKCRSVNMPLDNVQRAIAKATGGGEGVHLDELTYEMFGPGGVAMLALITTDNKNRTAAEIRHLLTKHGGNMATSGAVTRLFERKGRVIVARENADEDALMELAVEAGAEDFIADENGYEILSDPAHFEAVHGAIDARGIHCEVAEVGQVPLITVPINDPETAAAAQKLIELVEEHDDVNTLYTNAEFPAPPAIAPGENTK